MGWLGLSDGGNKDGRKNQKSIKGDELIKCQKTKWKKIANAKNAELNFIQKL